MKILLDECVNGRLVGHEAWTVRRMGWSSFRNGALLARATIEFEVFVTVDQNIPFQQSVEGLPIAIVVLKSRSIALSALMPLVPLLLVELPKLRSGTVTVIA